MKPKKFNIRVYGLVIEKNQILLTDEFRFGMRMAKFPGGGLKLGEGAIDCLKREMMEEMSVDITNIQHFYTTDFYQEARFVEPLQQVLNIYYTCDLVQRPACDFTDKPFDFAEKEGAQVFRWVRLQKLKEDDLTLPIDKVVLKKLQQHFS
ncbi:MAG TPA: NUDIX domain-containing protein [Bacteroidales bacterium]|nr:NUDIX domain-containing protein [Bacteroidales bacterium]